jgi:hypothetical protein
MFIRPTCFLARRTFWSGGNRYGKIWF